MKNFYSLSAEETMRELGTSDAGLGADEAAKRLNRDGANKLAEGKRTTLFRRFLKQIADPMIIVLIAAAAVSAVTAVYEGESFADVFIILFVVVLNSVLGVVQESRAEKAIDALKEMSSPTAKVLRAGKMTVIKSEELVVGDIILLEAGDAVPADARVIESASLRVEEAALTGESVPVDKFADTLGTSGESVALGDRKNMVYTASTVVYGRGRAVVTGTGMNTEIGSIADALNTAADNATPLQIRLAGLSKILTWLVLGICVFIFGFGIIRGGKFSADTVISNFMIAVSLAVAAIPEGLAAVVTIVLSIGVTKMSKRNAIIRNLTAVETLGCTEVICSDKTGTLTKNKMTVTDEHTSDKALLAKAMALCSDAEIGENGEAVGEPTECGLVNYAKACGFEKDASEHRAAEAPFDSVRKMMSVIYPDGGGYIQYTKGAPDEILARSAYCLKDGEVCEMTENLRSEILAANKAFADRALRVLAAGYRKYENLPADTSAQALERELVFIGLTGMTDPVREEVVTAMGECLSAGIRPVMITGDHKDTAVAIAKELGIIKDESGAMTGAELDGLSDAEFDERIRTTGVYARVRPEHKVRIVKTWKKLGRVTAMTGDGVNDAPAIKNADIGIGMGITGTDVTKGVADMVLADDNFATIVGAVGEGRRIYDNIRKAVQFLLSSNLSEVVSIFAATVMGFVILSPVHILWINLITDTLPALALGMEAAEKDLMKRKPRPKNEGIFAGGLGFGVVYQGLLVAALTTLSYFVGHRIESGVWEIAQSADGMTMAFLTMSLAETFHALNMRSLDRSIFTLGTHNKTLTGAMILSLLLTAAVIFVPPLASLFGFESVSAVEYAVAVGMAVLIIPAVEGVKALRRAFGKNKGKIA